MSAREILIGTRGSALALAQARLVAAAFERESRPIRLVVVETEGDRRAPDTAWGEGAFVAAIERALLDGHVDVAVHSAKDVPTDEDPRLRIGAFLPRADPRDVLVVRAGAREHRLDDLPAGHRVGTDSPRRVGFVLGARDQGSLEVGRHAAQLDVQLLPAAVAEYAVASPRESHFLDELRRAPRIVVVARKTRL